MKASVQSQIFAFMAQYLHHPSIVVLYVLSMSKTFTQQILLLFLTNRWVRRSSLFIVAILAICSIWVALPCGTRMWPLASYICSLILIPINATLMVLVNFFKHEIYFHCSKRLGRRWKLLSKFGMRILKSLFKVRFSVTDIWCTFFQHGVAVRSGHHCAQPLHRHLGVSATARASLYFYNTKEDVDHFIHALNDTVNFFASFK